MVAYGRGVQQDFAAAAALFQVCFNSHQHPGCALYLGLMHSAGQAAGRVDYDLARIYLRHAVDAGDVRFAEEAHAAYAELDALVKAAEELSARTLEGLKRDMAPPPEVELATRRARRQQREREEEGALLLGDARRERAMREEGGVSEDVEVDPAPP
jgi:hypothetical protein